jgi:hypothetical protein
MAAPTLRHIETAEPAAEVDAPEDAVRRKIAALKARKSVIEPTSAGFRFDPSEPLRLKNSGKKRADEKRRTHHSLRVRVSTLTTRNIRLMTT